MTGPSHGTAPAQHGGNIFLRIVGFLSVLSGVVSASLIVISVGVTCQMIFIRFVLNGSTVWQTEGVTYMMIAATMLGLPYVQYLRGHVNVDLLPLMLPVGARKGLAYIVLLMTLAVSGIMVWNGYHFWHEAWDWGETSNTPWNPKLWVPYLALPLGFGLYSLQLLADTWAMARDVEPPFGIDPDASLTEALAERSE
ncbi:TRAP transporter small permease [Roseobacter ponti]|uniref:TRAP transporter small permease protein n=1 Tax=Roseobacter ponti TaxID=1891787 RepID=A0A858SQW4_9RHOB|nr:TRAP transporter small permease [Roseobacter ponti]QJF50397.1 TRAP transporter small permease [Roseobacter ponti]